MDKLWLRFEKGQAKNPNNGAKNNELKGNHWSIKVVSIPMSKMDDHNRYSKTKKLAIQEKLLGSLSYTNAKGGKK